MVCINAGVQSLILAKYPRGCGTGCARPVYKSDAMPVIKILPHPEYCPSGAEINAPAGTSICEALLENHINIEHACDMSCAWQLTCHVIVRAGIDSLNEAEEEEVVIARPRLGAGTPVAPLVPGDHRAERLGGGDSQIFHQPCQGKPLKCTVLIGSAA